MEVSAKDVAGHDAIGRKRYGFGPSLTMGTTPCSEPVLFEYRDTQASRFDRVKRFDLCSIQTSERCAPTFRSFRSGLEFDRG